MLRNYFNGVLPNDHDKTNRAIMRIEFPHVKEPDELEGRAIDLLIERQASLFHIIKDVSYEYFFSYLYSLVFTRALSLRTLVAPLARKSKLLFSFRREPFWSAKIFLPSGRI